MFDIPIQEVQVVQEYIINRPTQSTNTVGYQLSEVDLSFSDALAGMCSSETSCGPTVTRSTTKMSTEKQS